MTSRQRKRVKRYRTESRVRGECSEVVYATGKVEPVSPSFGSAIALLNSSTRMLPSMVGPGIPGVTRIRWSVDDRREGQG